MPQYRTEMLQQHHVIDVVALAQQHHASSRYAHLPFIGERVYRMCEACMTLDHYGCVVLCDDDATFGYAAMAIEPYLWADFTIAHDLAVYVAPEARSMTNFKLLIAAVEAWCEERDVHTIDFGVTSPPQDVDAQRYGKVYEHVGYRWHGEHYRKEIG